MAREIEARLRSEFMENVCYPVGGKGFRRFLVDRIADLEGRVQELEAGWIAVEDGLPEENAIVLVAGGIAHHKNGTWYTDTGGDAGRLIMWEVSHWMPLPTPPEDSSDAL